MKKRLISALLMAIFGLGAHAYDTINIPEDNPNFQINIFKPGESITWDDEVLWTSTFDISNTYKSAIYEATKTWGERLNVQNTSPVGYALLGFDEYNAAAVSPYVNVAEKDYKVTWANAALNNYTVLDDVSGLSAPVQGFILLGLGISEKAPGWQTFESKHPLFHGTLPDLNATISHELMHSLGVTSNAYKYDDGITYFSQSADDSLSVYDKNLRIYTGSHSSFDSSMEKAPAPHMSVGKNQEFDVYNYSPYFVGENTIKVLGGKDDYNAAKQEIINKGGLRNYSLVYSDGNNEDNVYPTVYGLPIHPMDSSGTDYDLSHLELRNSFMSHQDYRNWLTPMEAELALMKDIGYDVELRKYFGQSYYLDNVTDTFTRGYSHWNGTQYTSAPSTIAQGVGLHIYGNNNNITQDAIISTIGEAAIGARIEGVNNIYTLSNGSKINANGLNDLGLAVTWGKNHTINLNSGSEINANGEGGIGVSFDFGKNMFGDNANYIGSYTYYYDDLEDDIQPHLEANDTLVKNFNVAGKIKGKDAAIYISENAHVENINIKNGAEIEGDIVSDWNSVTAGAKAHVLSKNGGEWHKVDKDDIDDIHFTNLNFENDYNGTYNGNIKGDNGVYNTLKMNNSGNLTLGGSTVAVNTLNNTGTINVSNHLSLSSQNNNVTGGGQINVNENAMLTLANVNNVNNNIELNNGTLSTINESTSNTTVNKINSNNGKLSFDLGDTFTVLQDSDEGKSSTKLYQIAADEDTISNISDGDSFNLFTDMSKTLDVSGSEVSLYYDSHRYTFTPDDTMRKLNVKVETGDYELSDAAQDPSTMNYIVTEDALTRNAGTVKGEYFTVSGKDINVNSHGGLVIDGSENSGSTTLKTGIYGASDSNLIVQNNGKLFVDASDKNITLGRENETALSLNKGNVELNARNNSIFVQGEVKGTDKTTDKINVTGRRVDLNTVNNVGITSSAEALNLNAASTDTSWQINSGTFYVPNDAYLASNGTNELILNGGTINTINNKTTDIGLAKMELVSNSALAMDVDLENRASDRFVFENSDNVITNDNKLIISDINLMNSNVRIDKDKYEIPIVGEEFNNQNLANSVVVKAQKYLFTPLYRYGLSYETNGTQGSLVFSRPHGNSYHDFNPAVLASSVGAQVGAYLTQINSYDTAFGNMDMIMSLPKSVRQSMKFRNKYAFAGDGANLGTYSPNQIPEETKGAWFRPYATFEKVGLKNGPKVENVGYGSYFGGDSDIIVFRSGWEGIFSGYAGYNGSHQNYEGISIYQNGGQIGATALFYKNNFFTGLTANIGASGAEASTMYGHEDFGTLATGIASKTGYNFGFADDKFIIQPSWLMSYSFVNTFDYTNAAGIRIDSDPLNAIQLVPGLKFIGNLPHSWQPYAGVQMIWNIMDRTRFFADDVALSHMSVKPYIQYGLGLQKRVGETFTGYAQAMIRNGGRNGLALTFGFRWAL